MKLHLLIFSTLLVVEVYLFQRFSTEVPQEDIVWSIPSSTSDACVQSCKKSIICKQSALTDAKTCLHLKRVLNSSVDAELFKQVQNQSSAISVESGKIIDCKSIY